MPTLIIIYSLEEKLAPSGWCSNNEHGILSERFGRMGIGHSFQKGVIYKNLIFSGFLHKTPAFYRKISENQDKSADFLGIELEF